MESSLEIQSNNTKLKSGFFSPKSILISTIITFVIVGLIGLFFALKLRENNLYKSTVDLSLKNDYTSVITNCEILTRYKPKFLALHINDCRLLSAKAYYSLKENDKALTNLLLLESLGTSESEVYTLLSEIKFAEGDINLASIYADKANQFGASKSYSFAIQAYQNFLNNDYNEAEKGADLSINTENKYALAYRIKAITSFWKGSNQIAYENASEAIQINTEDIDAMAILALINYEDHQVLEANDIVEEIKKINSTSATSLMIQAYQKYHNQQPYEGFEIISQAYKLEPNRNDILFSYAYLNPYQKSTQDPLNIYTDIYDHNPGFVKALLTKQKLLFSRYELEDDINSVLEEIELVNPNTLIDDFLKVRHLLRESYFEEADHLLNNLIEQNSDNPDIYMLYGDLLKAEKKYEEALTAYGKAQDISPNLINSKLSIAEIYILQENTIDALNILNAILADSPKTITALNLKSKIYIKLEDFYRAQKTISEALSINPNNIETLLYRVQFFINQNEYLQAFSDIEKGLSIQPNNPKLHLLRSQLYLNQGNLEKARNDINFVMENYPREPEGYIQQAKYYLQSDLPNGAVKVLDELTALNILNEEQNLLYSEAYLVLEKYQEALEKAEEYIRIKPDNYIGYYYRYLSNYGLKDLQAVKNDIKTIYSLKTDGNMLTDHSLELMIMKNFLDNITIEANGQRLFSNKDYGYNVTFGEDWMPYWLELFGLDVFTLTDGNSSISFHISEPIDNIGNQVSASSLSSYFYEFWQSSGDIELINESTFIIDDLFWITDTYKLYFSEEQALYKSDTLKNSIYIYVTNNQIAVIQYINALDEFDNKIETVEEIVKSFRFTN